MIVDSKCTVVVCVGTKRDCQCHRYLLLWQSFFCENITVVATLLIETSMHSNVEYWKWTDQPLTSHPSRLNQSDTPEKSKTWEILNSQVCWQPWFWGMPSVETESAHIDVPRANMMSSGTSPRAAWGATGGATGGASDGPLKDRPRGPPLRPWNLCPVPAPPARKQELGAYKICLKL